jgi:hypothetical protein
VANEAVKNLVVLGYVYGLHICLDLSSRYKAFYGSMMMGIIYYSSSFSISSMWE